MKWVRDEIKALERELWTPQRPNMDRVSFEQSRVLIEENVRGLVQKYLTCSREGCRNTVHAKGFCKHHHRFRNNPRKNVKQTFLDVLAEETEPGCCVYCPVPKKIKHGRVCRSPECKALYNNDYRREHYVPKERKP